MIDEISLMLVPAIDGRAGAPSLFDGPSGATAKLTPVGTLVLTHHEVLGTGTLWLRYRVDRR